jgi:hypothetical protein
VGLLKPCHVRFLGFTFSGVPLSYNLSLIVTVIRVPSSAAKPETHKPKGVLLQPWMTSPTDSTDLKGS